MSGHTKGPWKIDFGHPRGHPGGISQALGSYRPVTRFGAFARPSSPEALANARLIAAAPDLLEAAMGAWSIMEEVIERGHANDLFHERHRNLAAAIARATEVQP
jgi:hypothetical protein